METATGSIDIGQIKRCYIEGMTIKVPCPKCGNILEHDFSDLYVSYPEVGKKDDVSFYCDLCAKVDDRPMYYNLPIKIISAKMVIEYNPAKLQPE